MSSAISTPQQLRVFLASPGDVADERALARRLIEKELPSDPLLRGQVTFEVVSWDDPVAPPPMPATLTPQGAVIRFEGEPSTCDIVIVVLWSRLGTRLDVTSFRKPTGDPYLSGTEWEFENAWNANPRPEILVYRRMEEPKIGMRDLAFEEKRRQYQLVEQFFDRFTNPDGSFPRGVMSYETPTAFRERLETDLKWLLRQRLVKRNTEPGATMVPVWTDPPYPGLRSFTRGEGPIFFGRGREVDALIGRLRDPTQRFLAVIGASGTGKSSLIRAGLIPRLQDGAIEGSRDWRVVTCTPGALGDNPFLALASELVDLLPAQAQERPIEIATELAEAPQRLTEYAATLLAGQTDSAMLILFIDQLEELFTGVNPKYRRAFAELLAHVASDPRLRVLATLRADFLPQVMAEPALASQLQAGVVPLGPPGPTALADMIQKPAERAGLELEVGLVDEIVKDAGADPPLPLMAFCLEELYRQTAPDHRLTVDAYNATGRLRGAISRQAAALLKKLRETKGEALDAALPLVFQALVHVDAAGPATRRRAFWDELGKADPIPLIIDKLVKGRLVAAEEADGRATVTLAYEALLLEWPALRDWLDCNRIQLQRVRTLITALSDADMNVRGSAARALGQIGPVTAEVVPALITALADADDVRRSAADALGKIGSVAVPALITALADADDVRRSAAEALGRIGPAAAEAVPALIAALADADDVRRSAAGALGRIGPAAVPALITALGNDDTCVRGSAAEALGWIGPAAAEAVPALITTLADVNLHVRMSAAEALGQIGPAAAEAVPALRTTLHDPVHIVIEAAKVALERIQSASPAANSD